MFRKLKSKSSYFSKGEIMLWSISALLITVTFFVFDRENYLTLAASLVGVTSLIFNAKGNPFGQFLMIVFSILYGVISFTFAYYGEMITYLGMTGPMAVFALISWLRNPYKGNKAEVEVNHLKAAEFAFLTMLTAVVICCPAPCLWPPVFWGCILHSGGALFLVLPMPPMTWC